MNIRTEKFPRPPDKRENARRARVGALSKAGRLFAEHNTQTASPAQALAEARLDRMIERVHALGPRPLAELLAEIIRFLSADRFSPMPLQVAP